MSDALVAAILVLGLGVIVVRRRIGGDRARRRAVAARSASARWSSPSERSSEFLVASLVLLAQGHRRCRRCCSSRCAARASRGSSRRRHRRSRGSPAPARVALAAAALVPPLGLGDAQIEQTRGRARAHRASRSSSLRRPALLQLIGLIVAENGVALLAVSVPGGLSYVVELGALFDLVLVVTVAAAFTQRIHAELGTGDTELLRGCVTELRPDPRRARARARRWRAVALAARPHAGQADRAQRRRRARRRRPSRSLLAVDRAARGGDAPLRGDLPRRRRPAACSSR